MPRTCTVCPHADRQAIDSAVLSGESFRYVAKRFALSVAALYRHREHLPATLVKAHAAAEVASADSLLAQVGELRARAMSILDTAEGTGQLMPALAAIREARSCLELLGKLMGELSDAPQVNLIMAPQWSRLVSGLRDVLAPHPAILAQVATHLLTLEMEDTEGAARAG